MEHFLTFHLQSFEQDNKKDTFPLATLLQGATPIHLIFAQQQQQQQIAPIVHPDSSLALARPPPLRPVGLRGQVALDAGGVLRAQRPRGTLQGRLDPAGTVFGTPAAGGVNFRSDNRPRGLLT